jgi:hypothetical protein
MFANIVPLQVAGQFLPVVKTLLQSCGRNFMLAIPFPEKKHAQTSRPEKASGSSPEASAFKQCSAPKKNCC